MSGAKRMLRLVRFYGTPTQKDLIHVCHGFSENCSYLDLSRKDRTSYLRCPNYGCCGEFQERYCCAGPIPIVGGIFGGLLVVLIVAIIVGVCYTKHKQKENRVRPVPAITSEMYNDIPRPSPPTRHPPIYNPSRLHPPPSFGPSPFRHDVINERELHPPPSSLHPPRFKTTRKHSRQN